MLSDYAVWDLETTGFSPLTDAITEIGWLTVRNGVISEAASLLIQPSKPVPDDVALLTGITTAMLEANGVPLGEALLTFLNDTDGLPLVGHNVVRFDVPFLEAACQHCQILPPDRALYVDTAALYKARYLAVRPPANGAAHWAFAQTVLFQRTPGLKYNLQHACVDLCIETADVRAHRAAGDAELTQRLYAALMTPGVVRA